MGLWTSSGPVDRGSTPPASPKQPAALVPSDGLGLRYATPWGRSLQMLRDSFRVLRSNKKLLAFPVAASISALVVASSFLLRVVDSSRPATLVLLFLWYYFHYFVIMFFNGALMECVQCSFVEGRTPTIQEGLRAAGRRWFQIAMWTLAVSTVGVALRSLESQSRRFSSIIAAVAGLTWTLGAYFVMPSLMFDEDRLVGAVKRSMSISRRIWTDQLGVHAGLGAFGVLFAIPGLLLAAASLFLGLPLLLPAIVYGLILSVVLSAARTVSTVALYRYAVTGEVPRGFSRQILAGTLRQDSRPGDL